MDFNTIREKLAGFKTYGVLILIAITQYLGQEEIIANTTADNWTEMLTVAGGATFVAKINRIFKPPPSE